MFLDLKPKQYSVENLNTVEGEKIKILWHFPITAPRG